MTRLDVQVSKIVTQYQQQKRTYRAPKPVNRPPTPSCPLSLIKRPVVDSPGRALVLLILDRRVSAGWEMTAAAIPAMRPDPKLRVVASEGVRRGLGVPYA